MTQAVTAASRSSNRGGWNCDADVRQGEGGGVVGAVADHGDQVAFVQEVADEPKLAFREGVGVDLGDAKDDLARLVDGDVRVLFPSVRRTIASGEWVAGGQLGGGGQAQHLVGGESVVEGDHAGDERSSQGEGAVLSKTTAVTRPTPSRWVLPR